MRNNPSPNPRDRETAQEILAGRLKASEQLFYLFGGTDAAGTVYDGVLHQFALSALLADPNWKTYLDGVRRDPHAKTLAVISASRNDPKFPPAIVAELFTGTDEDGGDLESKKRWFREVFLAGTAEIHRATGKSLILPPNHPSMDLVRSAFNLVDHLSDEERKGLGLLMPDETPRRELATTLAGILAEAEKAVDEPGLTAAQRFFRWALRKWDDREDAADERRRQRATSGNDKDKGGDPASILPPPPGGKPALPAPPQAAATPALPPVPEAVETPTPPVPVAAAPAAPPAPSASSASVDLKTFVGRCKAAGVTGPKAVEMVTTFGKDPATAVELLEGIETLTAAT